MSIIKKQHFQTEEIELVGSLGFVADYGEFYLYTHNENYGFFHLWSTETDDKVDYHLEYLQDTCGVSRCCQGPNFLEEWWTWDRDKEDFSAFLNTHLQKWKIKSA